MKSVSLKKAVELFGGTEIEIHKGYHEQYGFFVKNGQLYYITSGDDRMLKNGQLDVMYRTANHRKDWKGGVNQWGFVTALNEMGYRLDKYPTTKERC